MNDNIRNKDNKAKVENSGISPKNVEVVCGSCCLAETKKKLKLSGRRKRRSLKQTEKLEERSPKSGKSWMFSIASIVDGFPLLGNYFQVFPMRCAKKRETRVKD